MKKFVMVGLLLTSTSAFAGGDDTSAAMSGAPSATYGATATHGTPAASTRGNAPAQHSTVKNGSNKH